MPSQADIAQLAAWLAATDLASLELRENESVVRLERRGSSVAICASEIARSDALGATSMTVVAETPGVFLHGHPLRYEQLVNGDLAVRQGQTVGLLRVGVLLLPVRAPCDGLVEGYWAADGATVGYGAPLMALRPLEPSP